VLCLNAASLLKSGLRPSDVQVVNLPASDLAKTLEKGETDAISIWEPYATSILQSGKEKLVVDSRWIKRGITVYLVVIRETTGERSRGMSVC
jgi:sulfonate transport system substrate-binding protein